MVNKINTYYCKLNLPEDFVEYESFSIIPIDSLFVYESKYYLQVVCH